jgi:prepilin-type N-terminal cleavage/methylation domain-containing protein
MKQRGFTVIELVVVIVVLAIGAIVFFNQKAAVDATNRDDQRKIAINSMYYNLEEVFYEQNQYYPQTIDSKTLRAMDPALFTDPSGRPFTDSQSDYRYQTTGCSTDGKCQHYTLTATLEREANFEKRSRR